LISCPNCLGLIVPRCDLNVTYDPLGDEVDVEKALT